MMADDKDKNIYSTFQLDHLSSYVLDALNAHIALLDREGKVIAHNKKWKSFNQELTEKWYRPELNENFLHSMQKPLSKGNDFALRMLLGCKKVLSGEKESFEINYPVDIDDKKHWFKATLNRLEEGKGAVFIHEDISHHVQNRKFIRETQQKFEQYFENSLYGIVVANQDNHIIEVNKVASELLESTVEELMFEDVNKFINMNIEIDEVQHLIKRHGNFIGELEIRTAKGNILPVEMHVSLFRNEMGISVTSWMFKDISEKKQSEEALKLSDKRYRLQFENSSEGIILAHPNGTIIEVNSAAAELLGYEPEELSNKERNLIFNDQLKKNIEAINRRNEVGFFSGELEFIHKTGRTVPVELNTSIYTLENGEKRSIINFRDISARKTIEEQLMLEKNFTDSAIASLPNAFFVFDETGQILRWNNLLEQDFGYTADEIPYLNIMDLVHPEERQQVMEHLAKDYGGEPVSVELRCITKTDETLHYLISGKGFEENGVHYTVGGGINLTNHKEIENEKRRNSELLTQLFFNSPIGIVLIGNDGKVKNSNKSFESIFGYSTEEIRGKVLDDVIVADNQGTEAKRLSQYSFTGDTFQREAIRINKDGNEIPVLIGGVPVEIDGEIIAIYGMYINITEQKNLESQIVELLENEKKARLHMEDMFEESPSAVAMVEGENHEFTFVNNEYKELTGKDNFIGRSVKEVFPELAEQGFVDQLDSCFKNGKHFQFKEKAVQFASSPNTHFLNFIFKPLYDDQDNIYGIFIHAINVTEQVEARNVIEKSLTEKETLLGEVHHRVKNNLAIISGLLELEMMDTEDEKILKHLNSSQSRITTIAKIHEMLYQNESLTHVSFSTFVENMLKNEKPILGANTKLVSQFDLGEVQLNINQAIPAGMLLNEIMAYMSDIIQEKGKISTGMKISLHENDDVINIEINDLSKTILQLYEKENINISSLRKELINVLLKQTNGQMEVILEEEHLLKISFCKREVKGSHSAFLN